jgi:hypothetical protein
MKGVLGKPFYLVILIRDRLHLLIAICFGIIILTRRFMLRLRLIVAPILTGTLFGCLAACTQSPGQPLPAEAVQASSGDKVITCAAPHDGKVFLRDDTDNKIVYSSDIRKDQLARFDPDQPEVSINGTISTIPNPNHAHSWYFAPTNPDRAESAPPTPPNNNNEGVQTVHVPIGVKVDVQTQPSNGN